MAAIRAIDKLVKSANLQPIRHSVMLPDGEEFVFYSTPMTASERERARKDARSDDATAFALQLLVRKATDENGARLFNPGDIMDLKNKIRDSVLQDMMLKVIGDDKEEEPLDMKSDSE